MFNRKPMLETLEDRSAPAVVAPAFVPTVTTVHVATIAPAFVKVVTTIPPKPTQAPLAVLYATVAAPAPAPAQPMAPPTPAPNTSPPSGMGPPGRGLPLPELHALPVARAAVVVLPRVA